MEDLKKCCFCGKEITILEQNNPWPASNNENDECCSMCNQMIVIPSRMALAKAPTQFQKAIDFFILKDGMVNFRVDVKVFEQLFM